MRCYIPTNVQVQNMHELVWTILRFMQLLVLCILMRMTDLLLIYCLLCVPKFIIIDHYYPS